VGLTDTVNFTCSACGHTAEFPKAQEGKGIYCPKCQAAQVVKAPGSGTDRFAAERIPTGRIVKAEAIPGTDRIEKSHGMAGSARIDFVCGACTHTSRISAALSGQPVRCPTCGTVQLAGVAGLRVVRLDNSGKLPFTCTSCNYQVRLSPDYSGKAIRCPKCQGAQVVPRVLRDQSGAQPVLPSGAAVVRSEPSSALRTPASGTKVPQPMPMPTPLPGSLATPPPEPTVSASARALPLVPTDDADADLDLGEAKDPAAASEGDPAPARARGGVVRRSGRMAAAQQSTSKPSDEPTLEAARAVHPEPEAEQAARAAMAANPTEPLLQPASAPAPSRSSVVSKSHPAWLVPGLGVAAVVAGIASIVLIVMLSAASGRESGLKDEIDLAKKKLDTETAANADLQRKLIDVEAGRKLVTVDRDEQRVVLDKLRRDFETLKAESERLKAEAAAATKPSAPVGGQPTGK